MHPANIAEDLPRQVLLLSYDTASQQRFIMKAIPHSIEFNRYNGVEEWLLVGTDVIKNETFRMPMRLVYTWVPIP